MLLQEHVDVPTIGVDGMNESATRGHFGRIYSPLDFQIFLYR
jgi:hypothetical protein